METLRKHPDSVRFSLAPLHSRCAIATDLTPARLIDFASVPFRALDRLSRICGSGRT